MSERGGGAGAFMFGVAVGTVLGLLLAPGSGEKTRAQIGRRLRSLRDLAGDKADEVKALLEGAGLGGGDEDAEVRSARRELEGRLAAARERRRGQRAARRGGASGAEEEDATVA